MAKRFDPMTGEPLEPVENQKRFDPMTGEPLSLVQEEEPIRMFDPMTGEPLQNSKPKFTFDESSEYQAIKHEIQFIDGEYVDCSIELDDGTKVLFGRNNFNANLLFENTYMSKKHCEVSWNEEQQSFIVVDLSKNGVFYEDGRRLPKDTQVFIQPETVLYLSDGKNVFKLV